MKLLVLILSIIGYLAITQDKPLFMNITYEYPWKDLEEEKRFYDEHFKFINNTNLLEKKFTEDMDLLKAMYGIQNEQIYKLNEIIRVNKAILREIESNNLK
jgi:hypothetical protein